MIAKKSEIGTLLHNSSFYINFLVLDQEYLIYWRFKWYDQIFVGSRSVQQMNGLHPCCFKAGAKTKVVFTLKIMNSFCNRKSKKTTTLKQIITALLLWRAALVCLRRDCLVSCLNISHCTDLKTAQLVFGGSGLVLRSDPTCFEHQKVVHFEVRRSSKLLH